MSELPIKYMRRTFLLLERLFGGLRMPRPVELAGAVCVGFGVAKSLCYGQLCSVLFRNHAGGGAFDATLDFWRIGVAVELVGCMLVCVWMTDPAAKPDRSQAPLGGAQRSAVLLLCVQLCLLAFGLAAGAWGIFQWGTGICVAACVAVLLHAHSLARRAKYDGER